MTEGIVPDDVKVVKREGRLLQYSLDVLHGSIAQIDDTLAELHEERRQTVALIREIKSIPPDGTCPMCGADWLDLLTLRVVAKDKRWDAGGLGGIGMFMSELEGYRSGAYGDYIPPIGGECNDCGLYETNPVTEKHRTWSRGATDILPYIAAILNKYPDIEEIRNKTSFPFYYFRIAGRWYTFGAMYRDDMMQHLGLAAPKKSRKPQTKGGYIYLIKADTGHYKIGRSKDVFHRVKTFGVMLPFDIELVHQFPADNMMTAESRLHEHFKHLRAKGEWFELNSAQVQKLQTITGYRNEAFYSNGAA